MCTRPPEPVPSGTAVASGGLRSPPGVVPSRLSSIGKFCNGSSQSAWGGMVPTGVERQSPETHGWQTAPRLADEKVVWASWWTWIRIGAERILKLDFEPPPGTRECCLQHASARLRSKALPGSLAEQFLGGVIALLVSRVAGIDIGKATLKAKRVIWSGLAAAPVESGAGSIERCRATFLSASL
jgi:hypothetical protein